MVQWLAPTPRAPAADGTPAAELTDEEIAAQRGDHILWFHPQDEAGWQEQFPYLAWEYMVTGGANRAGLAAGELAKIVVPFLTLDAGAAEKSFTRMQPTPAAWTRWLRAIQMADITPHPGSLSLWLREADTRIAAGGAQLAAALRMEEADLGPTEAGPDTSSLADLAKTILNAGDIICWGMLLNDDGKLVPAADLMYHAYTLSRAVARDSSSAWWQTISALYNIGCVDTAITTANKNDSDHVAMWMVRLLTQTELEPIVEVYHPRGFSRTMALRDRLAERAGAASRGDAGRGLVSLRIGSVLEHFRLISTLIAAEGTQERLRGQARLNWLMHAARVLLPQSSFDPSGALTTQLLQRVEDALGRYDHLLRDPDFREKGPLQRLADISERDARSATAVAESTLARGLGSAAADSAAGHETKEALGIPRQWRQHAAEALASADYMGIRKDLLARLCTDDGDMEIDALWSCSTGDSRERVAVRLKALAPEASEEDKSAAAGQTRRFCALAFFFAHGVYEPDTLDPALAMITSYAADYWPALLARRLAAVLLPYDSEIPTPLLGATCPLLLEALRGKDWHKADVQGATRYLRALMCGNPDAKEEDFKSEGDDPFGDPSTFDQLRKYYAVVLALFGYPDTGAKYGWGQALSRAAALWESYHGANDGVDARLRFIINKFLRAQFVWMGRHLAALKATKDPLASPPAHELDRAAWTSFLQAEGDLRTALTSTGLVRWAAVFNQGQHSPPGKKTPPGTPKTKAEKKKQRGTKGSPHGAAVEPTGDKSGFTISPPDGKAYRLKYSQINAELRKRGVPAGEEGTWCLKDLLGKAAFGASACHNTNTCPRKHGKLPSGSFDLAACKAAAGAPAGSAPAGSDCEGDSSGAKKPKRAKAKGEAIKKRKRKAEGAGDGATKKVTKAAAAAAAAAQAQGAEAREQQKPPHPGAHPP